MGACIREQRTFWPQNKQNQNHGSEFLIIQYYVTEQIAVPSLYIYTAWNRYMYIVHAR